jgi:hypothetical protein
MKNKSCKDCSQRRICSDSLTSWIFFIIGLVATIAIRIVTVLMDINPVYGKISWYIGVIGFLFFFIYKFNINRSLAKVIQKNNLLEKTRDEKHLSSNEYVLISNILCSLKSEKERINFFFIFAVSTVALIFAIYIDFIK